MMCPNATIATTCAVLVALAFPSIATGEEDHDGPYHMDDIAGSEVKRITLVERAQSRLGIQTEPVTLSKADRTFVVGGRIVRDGGQLRRVALGEAPSEGGRAWVAFPITEEIEDSLGLAVRVRPLNGAGPGNGISALADTAQNEGVTLETGGRLLFRLEGDGEGLEADEVVLVEVSYAGNGVDHKTVPYAAIIYDHLGDEWVYVSPGDGVYERHPVDVAYIKGDQALLLEGPEEGAQVVTIGGSELLGIEYGVGH